MEGETQFIPEEYLEKGKPKKQQPAEKKYHSEYYTVSKRSFESILENCNLTMEDITNLPKGATIVEVGSGINQEFARKIQNQRKDIKIISIDPTMAFEPDRRDIAIQELGDKIDYFTGQESVKEVERLHYKFIQQKRIKNKPDGSIAALAPWLPLRENSVDLLIDSYGPSLYLDNEETFKKYFKDIKKSLKPNCEARLYPISWITPRFAQPLLSSKEYENYVKEQINKMIPKDEKIKVDYFIIENGAGLKLTKF